MTTGSTPEYEKKGFKPPEFYEAAGNRFAILFYIDPNTQDNVINSQAKKVFAENPDSIDTVLVLVALGNNNFRYLVIERDGSWSEMCGNGARAVAMCLQDKYGYKKIILITKSNRQITVQAVEKDGETWYQVDMGQVTSVTEDPNSFSKVLQVNYDGNLEQLQLVRYLKEPKENQLGQLVLSELSSYLRNPEYLEELFPDLLPNNQPNPLAVYRSQFLNIFSTVIKEDEFTTKFAPTLRYRGLYQAGGEPHTLIEITDPEIVNILGEDRLSDYLKAVSFVLRHLRDKEGRRLYPQSMNFMFYTVQPTPDGTTDTQGQGVEVKMYPAERGVHNGPNYDQTGACGTGSCCLGNYLLKHDPRFTNEITIFNRSGIPLIVSLDEEGNTQLIGQAERTNR